MSVCKITSFLKADLSSRVEELRSKFVVGSEQLACHNEIQHTGDKWLKTHQYSQCDDYVKHDNVLLNEADVFKVFLMLTKTHGREIVEEFIANVTTDVDGGKKASEDFVRNQLPNDKCKSLH